MSTASIKFSGNLIEELSQKIPSSLFALNELIKNAYDAFSPDVIIKITPSNRTITISDNGNGMGSDEIESLFHISKSSKRYGQEIEINGVKRLTQGSKGLGFLSAFKFGDKVEWATTKNGIRSKFFVCKSELVAKEDVAGVKIPIKTDSYSKDGTVITVYSDNDEIDELLKDLSDGRILEKLSATIIDDSFDIKVEMENKQEVISTRDLKCFKKECEDCQLFYVSFDSYKSEIKFYHKGEHLKSIPFALQRTDYSVDIELIIFHFNNGKNSKSVSYLNRRVHDDALYPLVYINKNLFNNIIIFDPEVLRKKSSRETLPQMIGRVCVVSKSERMEFNSDRTNFVENSLTRDLLRDLESLNKLIQTEGADLKNGLKKSKNVPTGKAFPTEKEKDLKNGIASIFIDRKRNTTFYIPSEQIDLEEYIFQVKNSKGENVKKSDVTIMVNGKDSVKRVLNSVEEPCELIINFKYNDEITGVVISEILLSFEKKVSNISGRVQEKSLFTIQSGSGYKVSIETVSDIIHAIDKIYSTRNKDEYLPLIACSIRSVFEISSDKLLKTHKQLFTKFNVQEFNSRTRTEVKDTLLKNVLHIICLVNKNAKLRTKLSDVIDISFSTFTNLLNSSDFKAAIKNSHVGAHQSTRFLSKPKVEVSADVCGIFVVICDVMINMEKNDLVELDIV
ncbi:TPA: ATP-binding protein, partial [Vibrio cholerae]